jgi:membrane-bound inhibitor of C-type lysozyme
MHGIYNLRQWYQRVPSYFTERSYVLLPRRWSLLPTLPPSMVRPRTLMASFTPALTIMPVPFDGTNTLATLPSANFGEDYMKRCRLITLLGAAAIVIGQPPAVAQTLATYSCLDGSEFVVGFFAGDRSAHLKLDGKTMLLPRRLSLSGTRYAKGDISLSMTKTTTILKRGKRSTECTAA